LHQQQRDKYTFNKFSTWCPVRRFKKPVKNYWPKTVIWSPSVFFFRSTHPSHDDYGKTIGDIEKRFFAFTCQLKKLNGEILLSWFDIRFTGYKPEFNFLVGSNLGGPKISFPKISRKVKCFVCLFLYHDCRHIYCLNYIFDEFLEEKTSFDFFFSYFLLKIPIQ
jgi:hypothetical protein